MSGAGSGSIFSEGVFAKDQSSMSSATQVKAGVGYVEFAGPAIEALSMEERMTLCNMAIEGVRVVAT